MNLQIDIDAQIPNPDVWILLYGAMKQKLQAHRVLMPDEPDVNSKSCKFP